MNLQGERPVRQGDGSRGLQNCGWRAHSQKGNRYLQVWVQISTEWILISKLPQKHVGELLALAPAPAAALSEDKRNKVAMLVLAGRDHRTARPS